jgi:NADH-quinone oxidoreductase subunit L
MSSLFGAGDVNVFEHTLDPVIAEKHEAPHGLAAGEKKAGGEHAAETPAKAEDHGETHSPEVIAKERGLAALSTILAIVGIAIGFGLFKNNPLRKMPKILEQKWRLDEFYNGYIVDPITRFSRARLWKGFDVGFIDGIVNGIASFVMEFGNVVRSAQVGFVRSYAAIIVIGALAVVGYFIYYGLKLVG